MHEPLRIGVLGAARISDLAIVQPAHELGARLVSVAARDRSRAEAFASRHGFEKVLDNYQAVIDDPDVEVIYNPLANALHGPWNLRAIEGGKHVLTEKPFSSNVEEARRVRDAAKAAGVHVVEAVHSEYHPMMARMIELAGSGEIGDLEYVEVRMLMPPPAAGDIRWDVALAGGALMDVGCYAVHAIRDMALSGRGEPRIVSVRAGALPQFPGVDAWMSADMVLPNGVPAHFESSMTHGTVDYSLRLVGSTGEAYAPNFTQVQLDDRIIVTVATERREEHLGRRLTHTHMLEAFARLIREGIAMRTDADDAVVNMQMIDDLYRAAGMAPRRAVTVGLGLHPERDPV